MKQNNPDNNTHELSPELENHMRAQLAQFRADLPNHPYIKRKSRPRRWWHRPLKLATGSLVVMILCSAISVVTRSLVFPQFRIVLANADVFAKLLLTGDISNFMQGFEVLLNAQPPKSVEEAEFRPELFFMCNDNKHILAHVHNKKREYPWDPVSSGALWEIDIETGEVTIIEQGHLNPGTYNKDAYNRLASFTYGQAPQTWYYDKELGDWTEYSGAQKLWFYRPGVAPLLIEEERKGRPRAYHDAISPDMKTFAYWNASRDQMVLRDLESGEETNLFTYSPPSLSGILHTQWVDGGDSLLLISRNTSGSSATSTFTLISARNQEVTDRLALPGEHYYVGPQEPANQTKYFSTHVSFWPRSVTRSYGRGHSVHLFSLHPLREVLTASGEYAGIRWAPDAQTAVFTRAIVREQDYPTTLGLFDTRDESLRWIDFSDATQKPLWPHHFSPDGKYLVSGPPQMHLLDIESSEVTYVCHLPHGESMHKPWSPDSRHLAVCARDATDTHSKNPYGLIYNVETCQSSVFPEYGVIPMAWLDNERVLWRTPLDQRPLYLVTTDPQGNELRRVEVYLDLNGDRDRVQKRYENIDEAALSAFRTWRKEHTARTGKPLSCSTLIKKNDDTATYTIILRGKKKDLRGLEASLEEIIK
jgi:hypothetical protein